ncbi:MAG: DUF5696 domain-containing protein [Defluviitaleaceae bacterium]|nr:DUF5696 domain-containing protein [Defluviitaleaceae bacterium]
MKILKRIMKPRSTAIRRWRNVLLVAIAIAAFVFGFNIYLNSFEIYTFSHLTPVSTIAGDRVEFAPIQTDGAPAVPNMLRAAENEYLALYVHPVQATIAVYDKRNGMVWHSSPPGRLLDSRANAFERNIMNSVIGIRYFGDRNRQAIRWSYTDSVRHNQAEIFSIRDGVVLKFIMGNMDLGIHALPRYIETERFQTRVLGQIADDADRAWLERNFNSTTAMPDFMRMSDAVRGGVNAQRVLRLFAEIGYTLEELDYDNHAAGVESELTLDLATVFIEFMLEGDSLVVNVPVYQIEFSSEDSRISDIEIMRFFGAGTLHEDGFILIPAGSGALIEFNNGKAHEERFISPVYGFDMISNFRRPQVLQPVRLPLFGINRGGYGAFVAHIENGAALATITADVAGRLNSFNYAWFSFNLRASDRVPIGLPGVQRINSISVVQENAYYGDITVRYHFIAPEYEGGNITLGDMAAAYRNYLVVNGVLTPLADGGESDTTFFLDIVGAVDVRDTFLGVGYMTELIMTTFEKTGYILDILYDGGVSNVQVILHGWFNGGINHDVAKNVRRSRGLGSLGEMQALNERLAAQGGALNPAVNFTLTSAGSRNFNPTFEASRDIAGWLALLTSFSREALNSRVGHYWNDWYYLVHPAVIPFHIESFLQAYERNIASATGVRNIALTDLGDVLTESQYRRNSVDREHSRLIAGEQMGLIGERFDNVIVFGGNDYALRHATHLVDVPVRADWFYIIDAEVPFFQMVMHGYIEFAGAPINLMSAQSLQTEFLNSIATGVAPRFMMSGTPTRELRFSPYERLYTTYYANWVDIAISHYNIFNEVYVDLRTERIVDFIILGGNIRNAVTVTVFSNGTRIYVNNTNNLFDRDGIVIQPMSFNVNR